MPLSIGTRKSGRLCRLVERTCPEPLNGESGTNGVIGGIISVDVWNAIFSSFDQLASEYGGDWLPSKSFVKES